MFAGDCFYQKMLRSWACMLLPGSSEMNFLSPTCIFFSIHRSVKATLSLLCTELRAEGEPKKKKRKISETTYSGIKSSQVSIP